jgi:hypothetical protein
VTSTRQSDPRATRTVGEAWDALLDGRSRAEFCRVVRLDQASLHDWAHGARPRYGTVCQIAYALGRPISEIASLLDAIVEQGRQLGAEAKP